ncbi:MAG: putative bifunctional diguanylate cyclase/phosphodiesterase [Gemmatimonadota bacterium]
MNAELIRVLVVVPTPAIRASITAALPPRDGYEIRTVGTVAALRENAGPGRADVILLELPQPDCPLDPVAVALAHARDTPVLVVCPRSREALAMRAVNDGCAEYLLAETLSEAVVRLAIRHAVALARSERRRRQTERALQDSEHRYRGLFEQSRDAIYMTERNGEIVELNQAALDLLGYESDELIGSDVRTIYADPADRERFQQEIEALGHVRDFELRLKRKDGHERWGLMSAWVRRDPGGRTVGYFGIVHDISERKKVEDRLLHEAFHDALTGLPNRALFMDRLERAVARRRRGEERPLAVLFLDMDRFKIVNDSLGHMAGDELLRRMARLLADHVREEDTVARIGGDEFAILLDGVDDPADPTHVAERVQARLRDPFRIQGQDVFTSLSIGIAFGGAEVQEPEDLLRSADTAMYRAKELGPAQYQIFDEAMHAHTVTMLQLETDLRLALEHDEFIVHYQPLMDLATGRIRGFEALVRWQHPHRGLLPPQTFIPLAEDTGLIVPLGAWVLRTAVHQLGEWRLADAAGTDLFVSVNLSARQLVVSDLVEIVATILEEEGVPGRALRLEITESAMMTSPRATIAMLGRLRELGVLLCIDDFGTGYSSLSTLHELPIDILKIDRSFISRLGAENEGHVVESIMALARNLGMEAVAEGVETPGQLEWLQKIGPGAVQGFLFSTPVDPEAARKLLDRQASDAQSSG